MLGAIRFVFNNLARAFRGRFAVRMKSHMSYNGSMIVRAWPIGTDPGDFPVPRSLPLPLLTHLDELSATEWLRHLKIFGREVASFLPDQFPAYARVYHPFELSH